MRLSPISVLKLFFRQIYGITYMWNLTNSTNELIYKTETDSQTWERNLTKEERSKGGINQECVINRYTLPCIKKQPGFTVQPGNYIQQLATTYNGKQF